MGTSCGLMATVYIEGRTERDGGFMLDWVLSDDG
jgi:hypothetical protein